MPDATTAPRPTRALEITLAFALLLASLVLRLSALDVFLTPDEDHWYDRSRGFNNALRAGDYAGTFQSAHPGVVTMWIGTAAIRSLGIEDPGMYDAYLQARPEDDPTQTHNTGIAPVMQRARTILALVTWLGIGAMYLLLRRLVGALPALAGLALLALDPFYLTHSRLHHLDAILATFLGLSALALLVYQRERRVGYLLLSAAAGALAIANKSPGLFIAPWVALALLLPVVFTPREERWRALRRAVLTGIAWGMLAALTVVAIWPAMWVQPLQTIRNVLNTAVGYAENPHENLNYFWFSMRPDPGPAFYPVAWIFRTTPIVLLGLGALLWQWARRRLGPSRARQALLPLALLALGFMLFMTLGQKKFDRYGLPFFLPLDMLAGVGLAGLLSALAPRLRAIALPGARQGALLGIAALAQLAFFLPTSPYYITYYNPLVGGGRTAPKVLFMGWGEGMERAAAWLNTLPNAADLHAATWQVGRLATFFQGKASSIDSVSLIEPDYFVYYASSLQRRMEARTFALTADQQPVYTATVDGIDLAWIYPNTLYEQEIAQALAHIEAQADPASDLILLDTPAYLRHRYSGPLEIRVVSGPPREDLICTALQLATAGRQRVWFLTFPETDADTRGLIRDLLERHGAEIEETKFGEVRVQGIALDPASSFVGTPSRPLQVQVGEQVQLLGYDLLPAEAGQALRVRLHWRADAPVPQGYNVLVHLLDAQGNVVAQGDSVPQDGGLPTFQWQQGQVVLDEHSVPLPAEGAAGPFNLALGMYDPASLERLPVRAAGQEQPDGRYLIPDILPTGG